MHIPSGEGNLENFDAEKYAQCMEIAGVDTAYVYASNCLGLCLFPSEVGHRHSITDKRDIFGETVAALRKRGIGVVGYLNSWCADVARAHPGWQVCSGAGKRLSDDSRFGCCCLNSPYADYFHALVYEMVSKYDIEGLWVDMIGFYSPDCVCEYCREKYKKKTGFDLPTTIDWTDDNFLNYVKFKYDTVAEYAKGITEAAHRAKPDISISLQCASWNRSMYTGLGNDYFKQMDYVSGDFYSDRNKTDVVCRLLYNLSEDLPFEYMISRAPDLTYHTAIKDKSEILLQAYTAFLCGGSFLFIDAIDPDGGLNQDLYRMMAEVKTELEPFFKTIDHEAEILRDVAVYMNFDSYTTRRTEGESISKFAADSVIPERLNLLNAALMRAHIDYDIITPKNLEQLSRYKVIIVSDLYRMSEEECDKLRAFVKNGGRLYVSGESSVLSSDGKNKDRFMLEEVLGVKYETFIDRKPVYLAPTIGGKPLFEHFSENYPAMIKRAVPVVSRVADSAEVLATLTYPFTDARDIHSYSSAISNPPAEKTEVPALVYNQYGKGACIYNCAPIEQSSAVCDYDIFAAIIKSLLGEVGGNILNCEECEYLEYVVRHNPEKRHYTVSLLNYQNVKKIVPLYDVAFSLNLDIEPKKVYANLGTEVSCVRENGALHMKLSCLDIYDVVYIEY